ncbi:hypothetical protein [Chloroflexus sp.]|nr:hypothetical protein [Chloroflexus sp.]MCS6888626.1 hypothetical protein [Chloroflexus sp.]MDW8402650.1 hypothetical protein [Chloroflexus sp.]
MTTLILLAVFALVAGGLFISLRRVQPEPIRVRVRDRYQPRQPRR